MRVESLELRQFRNINQLDLHCPGELHLFIGPNAQGKTNILESLYVLSLGKSHRAHSHRELIQWGKNMALVKAHVIRNERRQRLEIRFTKQGKKVSKNGLEQKKMRAYIGALPTVMFAPEDLEIVKGSPRIRRRFLDMEIGQTSSSYVYHLSRYNKVITQRNYLLKEMSKNRRQENTLLEVLDEQLMELATRLWEKRLAFLDRLSIWAGKIHRAISQGKETLQIQYQSQIQLDEVTDPDRFSRFFRENLFQIRDREISRGITLIGPHRDDLLLMVDGVNLSTYGSQGQQRTAALSLKLAEIELIREETGTYPILLLDDVLSELDDMRKTHLLTAISGKVQTFVTATGTEGIDRRTLERAQVYHVSEGTLRRGN